jgi:hypothetical protein
MLSTLDIKDGEGTTIQNANTSHHLLEEMRSTGQSY